MDTSSQRHAQHKESAPIAKVRSSIQGVPLVPTEKMVHYLSLIHI